VPKGTLRSRSAALSIAGSAVLAGREPVKERPITLRPDWICEIVSEANRTTDTVKKLRRYHQAGVPHYWILDHIDRTLTIHRHTLDGYLVALPAEAGERVHAEPFAEIELQVSVLLGDDE
jgi:Uma2 family endonuclease